MNKQFTTFLFFLAAITLQIGSAQEITKDQCDQKAAVILKYKNGLKELSPELIAQLVTFITPCAEDKYGATSPAAAYAKGRLHLIDSAYGYIYNRKTELSALHINRAAHYGYQPAMFDHTINLLTNVYQKKERLDYRNIAEDMEALSATNYKPDIVHYILGYLHLKNLQTTDLFTSEESAIKAKNYFEKSAHPMAKHWLAVMHYFGYATPQDKAKALQMLADNKILNSTTLAQTLQNQDNNWIPISAAERLACLEGFRTYNSTVDLIGDGTTQFNGHFIEFDWMAKGVKRYLPISITFTQTEALKEKSYIGVQVDVAGTRIVPKNVGFYKPSRDSNQYTLSFTSNDPLVLPPLQNLLKDHPDKDNITFEIDDLYVRQTRIDGKPALVAKVTKSSMILEYNERMNTPYSIILYPDPSNTPIANQRIQNGHKILDPRGIDTEVATIYPNPVGDEFVINYTLDKKAVVQLSIYDLSGNIRLSLPLRAIPSGTYPITIDSSSLISGSYLIQMMIDGHVYSKNLIKQ